MHTVAVCIDALIAPHAQVLAGIEYYRSQHALDWSLAVVTQGARPPLTDADTLILAIHSRMIPQSLTIPKSRPALGLFGLSNDRFHRCIALQETAFGDLAAQHFAELGLRQVAFIPSAQSQGRSHFTHYYQGLADACGAMGITLEQLPPGSDDGDAALCAALHEHMKPFAIYCATDAQAAWLRDRCLQEKLRVPEDVAILGTSDHPHHCHRRRPTLSSIAFPWFLMGRALGLAAHQQLSGIGRPEPQTLRPLRVVERESTAIQAPEDHLVAAALVWLQQHLHETQPLVACAVAQGCSVPTLSRRFRKVLGSSVKQVHARLRHREAMRLLASGSSSIASIAQTCGYADAAALSVAFKRHSGWSPGRWRLAARS